MTTKKWWSTNKVQGLKVKRVNKMWCLSTAFFGTEISAYAKTYGRAYYQLNRMFDERMHDAFDRVWEGVES